MDATGANNNLVELAADIVSAYVSNNSVRPADLPERSRQLVVVAREAAVDDRDRVVAHDQVPADPVRAEPIDPVRYLLVRHGTGFSARARGPCVTSDALSCRRSTR